MKTIKELDPRWAYLAIPIAILIVLVGRVSRSPVQPNVPVPAPPTTHFAPNTEETPPGPASAKTEFELGNEPYQPGSEPPVPEPPSINHFDEAVIVPDAVVHAGLNAIRAADPSVFYKMDEFGNVFETELNKDRLLQSPAALDAAIAELDKLAPPLRNAWKRGVLGLTPGTDLHSVRQKLRREGIPPGVPPGKNTIPGFTGGKRR